MCDLTWQAKPRSKIRSYAVARQTRQIRTFLHSLSHQCLLLNSYLSAYWPRPHLRWMSIGCAFNFGKLESKQVLRTRLICAGPKTRIGASKSQQVLTDLEDSFNLRSINSLYWKVLTREFLRRKFRCFLISAQALLNSLAHRWRVRWQVPSTTPSRTSRYSNLKFNSTNIDSDNIKRHLNLKFGLRNYFFGAGHLKSVALERLSWCSASAEFLPGKDSCPESTC